MAKPFQEWPGNGMHVHVSVLDESGTNVFSRGAAGERLLQSAVAGTLRTMTDCLALFINTFNGFRRLAPGSYAPTRVTWGTNNRSVAVRVPISKPDARRLEHRIAGADANPYLVLAGDPRRHAVRHRGGARCRRRPSRATPTRARARARS